MGELISHALEMVTICRQVGRLRGHQREIRDLAFLPDGNGLVSVSMDSFRIWRAPPLAKIRVEH